MWLTHKVGLSAGGITIDAGIISEGGEWQLPHELNISNAVGVTIRARTFCVTFTADEHRGKSLIGHNRHWGDDVGEAAIGRFLRFASRWSRLSGLTVRECVLVTLSGQ